MSCVEVLNIVALILVPLTSVLVGRWLQDSAEKRKDKIRVLKAIMTYRYGWTRETVEALNIIPIVFSGKRTEKKVRDCWKEYYKCLCIQNMDAMQLKQCNDALFKLIESMADDLGYKEVLTWEEIQNPYIPKGMVDSIANNSIIQGGMASIVQSMITNNCSNRIEK